MLICTMTLADIGEDKWVYALQYSGRIFYIDSPEPWESLAILEQEDLVLNALQAGFAYHREAALLKRPEDTMEDELLKRGLEAVEFDPEDEGLDEEDILSDFSTQELWDELQKREQLDEREDDSK